MVMKTLVSIIVPVYNEEAYLGECIESILSQTYENIEIILVDDGSTDASAEICDEYQKKDPHISVIHKNNEGLSSARNCGILASKGQYITFVDADDLIGPDMIRIMVDLVQKENADIVKVKLRREENKEACIPTIAGYTVYSAKQILKNMYQDHQYINACEKLFSRHLFDECKFPVGRYYEDEFIMPRLYLLAKKVVISDSIQYFYMQRENESILRSPLNDKKCMDAVEMSKERIYLFRESKLRILYCKAIADYYYRLQGYEKYFSWLNQDTVDVIRNEKEKLICKHYWIIRYIQLKNIIHLMLKGK